jgi:hypothetical protein
MTNWLMLFRKIITVYCNNHAEHIKYAVWAEYQQVLEVKTGGTHSLVWMTGHEPNNI